MFGVHQIRMHVLRTGCTLKSRQDYKSFYLLRFQAFGTNISSGSMSHSPKISQIRKRPRVVVAMSGGIDSAATAYILKSAGFDCVGVFMKNWDSSDEAGEFVCSYSQDLQDMRDVCSRLEIPALEVEFVKEYWNGVFTPFLEAYQSGIETPNPDVNCNRIIKFKQMKEYALKTQDADFMATGHYVQLGQRRPNGILHIPNFLSSSCSTGDVLREIIELSDEMPVLIRGVDSTKDQSYFLSMTSGEQLRRVLCPLGGLTKKQVRQIVREPLHGLRVLEKAESMGVCFIGKRKFSQFLGQYINLTPGRFIDVDTGHVVGTHQGKEALTAGQGARIGGAEMKYFVVAHDADVAAYAGRPSQIGDILVARGSDHPALFSTDLSVHISDFSWVNGRCPEVLLYDGGILPNLLCKARYNQPPVRCFASRRNDRLIVSFENQQRSLTAGQICALYQNDICLGGGKIATRG